MKITRKHIFIISGIIGLIVLVIIIIKVANTTPKTCDTSSGKKLYCNGENTVCIDCGQGKTYDCDKGMCVVTCDTSTGNKLYCDGEECINCGLNKTYDCSGKKCICDIGLKECNGICCPDEKTCIKGVKGDSCCLTGQQCARNSAGDYTTCCIGTDHCIKETDSAPSFCCDEGRTACGLDSAGNYTTCCEGDQICNSSTNKCDLKCSSSQIVCGTSCTCDPDKCIKPGGGKTDYCCPTGAVPCGKNTAGDWTTFCSGAAAVCNNNVCEVPCSSPYVLQCSGQVCALPCNVGEKYDCKQNKCICDTDHPSDCENICCISSQSCYYPGNGPNPLDALCCDTNQRCGGKNGVYTSCCGPNYMCTDDGKGGTACVLKCTLDNKTFLNCAGTGLNGDKCIKGLNLSNDAIQQLKDSAKTDENIVDSEVLCNGNDCAFCIINDPSSDFDQQIKQYPIVVKGLTVGSYIIGNLGGTPHPGYCSATGATDYAFCNGSYTNIEDCNKDIKCLWNNFIPQKGEDIDNFYEDLDQKFTFDENVINKYNNNQDAGNDYYGVWQNKDENDPSTFVTIKQGNKVSISDCIAINKTTGVTNITYYDTNSAKKDSTKLCLAGSNFVSIPEPKCDNTVSNSVYKCNSNGNITQDMTCQTSCEKTNYGGGEKWYSQPRQPSTPINKQWSCNKLNVDSNDMRLEDTVTPYCPEAGCLPEWAIQSPIGVCSNDHREWNAQQVQITYIGVFPWGTLVNKYFVPVKIINKTGKEIICHYESGGQKNDIGITINSYAFLGVQGGQTVNQNPFGSILIRSYDNDKWWSQFNIYYNNNCTLTNFALSAPYITATINCSGTIRSMDSVFGPTNYWCGITIVYYPTIFQPNLPVIQNNNINLLTTGDKTTFRYKGPQQ